jgi:hypothetical protein
MDVVEMSLFPGTRLGPYEILSALGPRGKSNMVTCNGWISRAVRRHRE